MKTTTETVCSDPWIFSATAKSSSFEFTYVGEEGESRSVCRRKAEKGLTEKIAKEYNVPN